MVLTVYFNPVFGFKYIIFLGGLKPNGIVIVACILEYGLNRTQIHAK